jgi:hypothetical protein
LIVFIKIYFNLNSNKMQDLLLLYSKIIKLIINIII